MLEIGTNSSLYPVYSEPISKMHMEINFPILKLLPLHVFWKMGWENLVVSV